MAGMSTGFVLLDSGLNLIASNQDALHILAFPTPIEQISRIDGFLHEKIRSNLLKPKRTGMAPAFVSEFRSGERRYSCSPFLLQRRTGIGQEPAIVLLLEREAQPFFDMPHAAAEFDLTPREQETVEHLLRGLTTKEIADRMKISPSTVNAFLRLVMVKIGVNSRSAVVHRILRHPMNSRQSRRWTD
jgi:DNA-binding CsgD family transcriptional regulator